MKLKILALQKHNPFYVSSASANRFRSLAEGLASHQADITIYITSGYKTAHERRVMGSGGELNGVKYVYLNNRNNVNIWMRRFNTYLFSFFSSSLLKKRFRDLISRHKKAIIWPGTDLLHYKFIKPLRKNNDYTLFVERNEFPDIHRHNRNTFLQKHQANQANNYFNKYILPYVDGMALITKQLLNYYKQKVTNDTKLIHLPMTVDLDRFVPEQIYPMLKEVVKPYVVFIGWMSNQKDGVNILIDSFASIAKEFQNTKLYLFGFEHYDSLGHQLQINDHGLQNRIIYKGAVDRDKIPHIIMNADLLVLPRPNSHQAEGGFPTKLGEYLASGKPVCATTVGEIPNYLKDGESVYFAEPGSADSFANALRRALSNPAEAKRIGANGRKVAEVHFNKEIQAKKLYELLCEL